VKENCSGTSGQEQKSEESDDATMKTAAWLLDSVAGITLSKEQKKTAGPVVYYVFGAAMGALYGALMEHKHGFSAADGAVWGAALFVGADEVVVPALGLSEPPTKYPLALHASALTAHLVYGLTTEVVRRKTRRALMLV
jgi:putative membrane protein